MKESGERRTLAVIAEGEKYLRMPCKVEDRFASFNYVSNALRDARVCLLSETRVRRLPAEIEYFQRHFPTPLFRGRENKKKEGNEVSPLTCATKVSAQFLSSLASACRTIFSFMHIARHL